MENKRAIFTGPASLNIARLILLVTILAQLLTVTHCASCFECSSLNETYCPEMMIPDDEGIIPYNDCKYIHEGRYCVKAVGIIGGSLGTRRFCSSRDLGNYCEYIRRPGDQREYRSCVYTCTGDGCNGTTGGPSLPNLWSLVAASVLSILFLHFRDFFVFSGSHNIQSMRLTPSARISTTPVTR